MRLRGRLARHGFEVSSYDLGEARATADLLPSIAPSEQVPSTRIRELVRAALELARTRRARPDARRARAADPARRPLRPCTSPSTPSEAEYARRRLAFDELFALQLAVLRTRVDECARRQPLGEPGELVARYRDGAAVRADRAPGARDRRDRPRPRTRRADAAAAPGRRRLRQDGGRSLRAAARGRGGAPGSADGADGDACRAALPHDRGHLRASSGCASCC